MSRLPQKVKYDQVKHEMFRYWRLPVFSLTTSLMNLQPISRSTSDHYETLSNHISRDSGQLYSRMDKLVAGTKQSVNLLMYYCLGML